MNHNSSLLNIVNPQTGYNPLHTAVSALQIDSVRALLEYGAVVTQPTAELAQKPGERSTAFHLATKKLALERLAQEKDKREVSCSQDSLSKNTESSTHKMLDLLLANLPSVKVDIVVDSELGSILHYFAAMDYVKGIRQLAAAPYHHPPDIENQDGATPLLLAIRSNSFDAIKQLLELEVNVQRTYSKGQQTALRLIAQEWLESNDETTIHEIPIIVNKLVEKGKC
jgi:ankyrin repeat protein